MPRSRAPELASSALLVAALGLAPGCHADEADVVHRVVPHAVQGCAPDPSGEIELRALGDFAASASTTERFSPSGSTGRSLAFPEALLGVEAIVRGASDTFAGIARADGNGDVDVTVWSATGACDATDPGGALALPAATGGEAITAFAAGSRVLVAGGEVSATEPNRAARALVFDVRTGAATTAGPGLHARRAWASATAFGEGALVAGGVDPAGEGAHLRDAEVLSGDAFGDQLITLSEPRARHGAVVLASGETLLVGGEGDGGKALRSIEAVDPTTLRNRLDGIATLATARKDPVVLRLASGEILVAGGTDDAGAPVATIEWLAADGGPCALPACAHATQSMLPKVGRALVALAGGGALAVGGVDPGTGAASDEAWWITAGGAIERLPSLPRPAASPRLVEASDGAPFLWDGVAWQRFDPWTGELAPPAAAPADGPDADLPAPIAVDPGLFAWLSRGDGGALHLRGFRHGVRGPLARDVVLLAGDGAHLAPDRLAVASGALSLDAAGLHLSAGAGAIVTDTTYANLSLSADTPSGGLPRVRIGDVEAGGPSCPWPAPSGTGFAVWREDDSLTLTVGDATATCAGPAGRVGVGLLAPMAGEAVVRALRVGR